MVKVPSSDVLNQLGLRKGVNNAKFSIAGNTPLECRIFLWNYKTKLVISDIDGTITTSDVFGQLMHVFK
jgi:phosphatidate phosphatase LPIN